MWLVKREHEEFPNGCTIGEHETKESAKKHISNLINMGFLDAYIEPANSSPGDKQ